MKLASLICLGRESTQRGEAATNVAPVANRLYRGLPTRLLSPKPHSPDISDGPPTDSRRYSRLGSLRYKRSSQNLRRNERFVPAAAFSDLTEATVKLWGK